MKRIFHGLNNTRIRLMAWLRSHNIGMTENYRRILAYKDRFAGQRCFLIGNGPSLVPEDLDRLRGEICFGCNLIYNMYDKVTWRPDFYCLSSFVIAETIGEKLYQVGARDVFTSRRALHYLGKPGKDLLVIDALTCEEYNVVGDISAYYIPSYATVMTLMLELAMYMGFSEIYLLGVDCTSSFSGDGHFAGGGLDASQKVLESAAINKTSFARGKTLEEYGEAMRQRSLQAYRIIAEYAEAHGVKIHNATRGGKLDVFERVDFDSLIMKETGHFE